MVWGLARQDILLHLGGPTNFFLLARLEPGMRAKKAADASEMASHELDRLGDPSATDDERLLRKRRLMKGPKEFRDIRNNARIKR